MKIKKQIKILILFILTTLCVILPSCIKEKEVVLGSWNISEIENSKEVSNIQKVIKNIPSFLAFNDATNIEFMENSKVIINNYVTRYEFLDDNKIKIGDDEKSVIFYIEVNSKNNIILKNNLLTLHLNKSILETLNIEYDN